MTDYLRAVGIIAAGVALGGLVARAAWWWWLGVGL